MTSQTPSIEFHRSGDWTSVYLDGQLERVGDSYLADEWLQERFGIKVVQDDAFLRGGNGRDGVAQTLDAVHQYQHDRDARTERVRQLRAEADALEARK